MRYHVLLPSPPSTTHIDATMPAPTLLTLPLEIREIIWRYYCDDSSVMLNHPREYWCPRTPNCPRLQVKRNRVEILLVCHQVYTESYKLFIQRTKACCSRNLLAACLLSVMTPQWCDNLTDLTIESFATEFLLKLCKIFPRLKVLRLWETGAYFDYQSTLPSLYRRSGDELLRSISTKSGLMSLSLQYPDLDFWFSNPLVLSDPDTSQPFKPSRRYVSLALPLAVANYSQNKLARFRSKTMTITFAHCRHFSLTGNEYWELDELAED